MQTEHVVTWVEEDREKVKEFLQNANPLQRPSVRSMVKATHVLGITLLVCCILQASFLTGARRVLFVSQHAHCFFMRVRFPEEIARETNMGPDASRFAPCTRAALVPVVDSQRAMARRRRTSPRSRAAAMPGARAFGFLKTSW
jgi:hypothetical protein